MAEVILNPFGEDDPDEVRETARTYKMDFDKKRIVGMIDGAEAAGQSILKSLLTRRFAYRIYDDQYGNDLFNKIGNTDLTDDYFETDIPVMIEDCLRPNDLVEEIEEMTFEMIARDGVEIDMLVKTVFGEAEIRGDIDNG